MPRLSFCLAAAALSLLTAGAAAAGPVVSGAWWRAMPAHLPAGGYFELKNDSAAPLSLVGAASPACGMVMLHQSKHMGGMAHMVEVTSIDVPPGGKVSFAPGGYHLMCMQPTAAMTPGANVPVTLKFADGTRLTVTFAVRDTGGH